ncbi:uncharacterized protein [Amphiura filiformis]|uniref:uncharacterized protein n=1 Tax=Amphiura filiformis TaxID=82378 RepID=UPI003B21F922
MKIFSTILIGILAFYVGITMTDATKSIDEEPDELSVQGTTTTGTTTVADGDDDDGDSSTLMKRWYGTVQLCGSHLTKVKGVICNPGAPFKREEAEAALAFLKEERAKRFLQADQHQLHQQQLHQPSLRLWGGLTEECCNEHCSVEEINEVC